MRGAGHQAHPERQPRARGGPDEPAHPAIPGGCRPAERRCRRGRSSARQPGAGGRADDRGRLRVRAARRAPTPTGSRSGSSRSRIPTAGGDLDHRHAAGAGAGRRRSQQRPEDGPECRLVCRLRAQLRERSRRHLGLPGLERLRGHLLLAVRQQQRHDLFVDVLDNRNPGSTRDDAERWSIDVPDNFSGWQEIQIPFASMHRKEIGNGAPNDGFGLTEVHGWALGAITTPAPQTYYVDNATVYGVAPITPTDGRLQHDQLHGHRGWRRRPSRPSSASRRATRSPSSTRPRSARRSPIVTTSPVDGHADLPAERHAAVLHRHDDR